jgi:hypothetical protein
MKKTTYHELAKMGMRARLQAIEEELRDGYREFPDVFLVPPPQLVRPELRNGHVLPPAVSNGNGHADAKVAQLVPYLLEHGPTRQQALAQALGLKSAGSLSTALKKRIAEGTVKRIDRGLYAAGDSDTKPTTKPTTRRKMKTTKPKVDVKAQRARTARVLEIVANADGPMPGRTLAGLSGMKGNAFGVLVSRGYLKSGAKGFTRTAKEFTI